MGVQRKSIKQALEQLEIIGNDIFGRRATVKDVLKAVVRPYVDAWMDARTDIARFGADMMHKYTLAGLEKTLEDIVSCGPDAGTEHLELTTKETPFRSDPNKCRA